MALTMKEKKQNMKDGTVDEHDLRSAQFRSDDAFH